VNNPDHIFDSLETIFWVKILKFFDANQGWKKNMIWDPGWKTATKYYFFCLFCSTGSGTLQSMPHNLIEAYLMCASSPRLEQMRTATARRITTAITELEMAAEICKKLIIK
jgi:hypothetical protein